VGQEPTLPATGFIIPQKAARFNRNSRDSEFLRDRPGRLLGDNDNAVDVLVVHHPISSSSTSMMKSKTMVDSRITPR